MLQLCIPIGLLLFRCGKDFIITLPLREPSTNSRPDPAGFLKSRPPPSGAIMPSWHGRQFEPYRWRPCRVTWDAVPEQSNLRLDKCRVVPHGVRSIRLQA